MKTTLDLPEDLMREVKLRAVMQRRPLKDLVADMLRQGMGMTQCASTGVPAANSLVHIGTNGLPVIKWDAKAPAGRMRVRKLLALEQAALSEEDMKRAGESV
jgi:hypothetical protein